MKLEGASPEPRLRALRAQLVQLEDGILVKRGRTELKVGGERAAEVLQDILGRALAGATRNELVDSFAAPDREAVERLIRELEARRILVTDDGSNGHGPAGAVESALDIFAWHFGETAERLAERVSERRVTIMGINCIS